MSTSCPIPEIRLFQTLTLKLQGQGHGCGQRAKSYSWPSILLTRFLLISHQSDQQSLRYSYFEIWPWNIQGQGHEWGQRLRSHIIPSIQLMHFFFIHINRTNHSWDMAKIVFDLERGKSEGFDSCDRSSNLTQIGFKSIFQPVWPWNLMDK